MASLGSLALLAAFVIASGAFAASIAGARRGRQALIDGGIGLFHVVTALMLLASSIIVHAFVTSDYRIKYVQHYSDEAQPLFYKLTSYWGGLDGSIMFWVTLLALFGSIAARLPAPTQVELISVDGLRVELHLSRNDLPEVRALIGERLRKLVCHELEVVFA